MQIRSVFLSYGVILSVLSSLLIQPATVKATGIDITPTSYVFALDPGQTRENRLFVKNSDANIQKFNIYTQVFKPSGESVEDGQVTFSDKFPMPDPSIYKITISPSKFTLDSAEQQEVTINVVTAKGTPPGGYYVGLVVETVPNELKKEAMVGQQIKSVITIPILTQVSGDTKQAAELVSFKTEKATYSSGPVKFLVEVKNTGNIHFPPIGRVDVSTPDGQRIDSIQFEGKNILPGDSRTVEVKWDKRSLPLGRKKATAYVFYGNKTLTKEVEFEVLPGGFASGAGTTVAVLVGLAVLFLFFGKKRKKRQRSRHR